MKGGVSSTVGSTFEGMVTMCFSRMNEIRLLERIAKCLQQLVRRRVIRLQFGKHLLRAFSSDRAPWPRAQIPPGCLHVLFVERQQLIERRIDHLVVKKLLGIDVSADGEISI